MVTNIMIVGVGGQGSLLASKLLGALFVKQGYDVKVSEVHGMSQRGGSAITYVRFGDKVYSPVINEGQADFILSFEKLEGARWVSYLKPTGKLIVNSQEIEPMPVITGAIEYPVNLIEKIKDLGVEIYELDAIKLASEAGNIKSVNLVLIGKLSNYFDFDEKLWLDAIEECVPNKFVELNKKAFMLGRREE